MRPASLTAAAGPATYCTLYLLNNDAAYDSLQLPANRACRLEDRMEPDTGAAGEHNQVDCGFSPVSLRLHIRHPPMREGSTTCWTAHASRRRRCCCSAAAGGGRRFGRAAHPGSSRCRPGCLLPPRTTFNDGPRRGRAGMRTTCCAWRRQYLAYVRMVASACGWLPAQ